MILSKKTTVIQAISHNLEKLRADLSQDYLNVMHLSMLRPSSFMSSVLLFPFAVFLLCCSTVLSGYCNVSFSFLGILRIMELYHFA